MKPHRAASLHNYKVAATINNISNNSPILFTRNDGIFMSVAGIAIAISIVCAKLSMFQSMIEGI
ncbi:MAG: hypothetical protein CMG46_04215 [Candidatus Marinimicrobia bacterium]|nr:hypothetical protein [Candidatus Neomarinimicrobiota bacterium]